MRMEAPRYLIVIADDFGIGPETSRGILELAGRGVITGTVLMVNSPHAEEGVARWRQAGGNLELGWHPCLTMDRPCAPPEQVGSLVAPDGCLWPLGIFLRRLLLRQIRPEEIERELAAQLLRFIDLVGHPPTLVNSHQHTSLFPPVGAILRRVLAGQRPRPYLRRVREPWSLLARIPGARVKRLVLTCLGSLETRKQRQADFPGLTWLAGITDPPWVKEAAFFVRWLSLLPGQDAELACHPGYLDTTLLGRDCGPHDGLLQRRVDEFHLLGHPSFFEACRSAGFTLISPTQWIRERAREVPRAA